MRRTVAVVSCALLALLLGTGGNCSRARVESMNQMNEGVVLAQQKRYVESVERLQQATVMDGTNDEAYYNLALVHMEMHKFDQAKEDLQRAIAIDDAVAGYHEKLGTVLMELEDWNGAKTELERAIALDANLFKAYYKLAQVLERLDDQQNALRRYTESIQHGPRFLEAYGALGRLYADLGYLNEAVQVFQSALQVAQAGTEEEAQIHHLLGTVYQQQRNFPGAVTEFRAALAAVPGMRDALFSLGWTYALEDDREEARRYLKKYLDVAGNEAPQHYVKAARDRLAELGDGP